MTLALDGTPRRGRWPLPGRHGAVAALALAALGLALAALALGPVAIPPAGVLEALAGGADPLQEAIVRGIRLPRLLLGLAVGTALALAGGALQGMLRNPLADPALVGVSAGASVGAVAVIVLGGTLAAGLPAALRPYLLPAAAFLGAGAVIGALFALARRAGETSVATLILGGVAINAIAAALIGVLVFVSDDEQLRELTFWTMGSLASGTWPLVLVTLVLAALTVPVFLGAARGLDLMQLGERAAFHAGLDVERLKRRLALATAVGVGAATAAAGPIGFVGLVAPHLARLTVGPAHRAMLPVTALYGMVLVLAADLAVRLAVPPAELPIGLATSLIGGPFFLWLLLRRGRR
ncbi:hypothetical protein LNKW23_27390 [Paralimibaculum aggregatum]|uniref:Iron complex transport system permease protein n=1 Tax=Paralimibaculum aggregatum TaxID=3036245 RepID=A0ABQ6LR62_9RHOB|nr:hypothetical protein LNKW23_27390 [Limibaculum sp. NKW23]